MKKVYIPIIAILIAACIFSAVQWRIAYQKLQTSQNQIQQLTNYLNYQQQEIDAQKIIIEQQRQQIIDKGEEFIALEEKCKQGLQLALNRIEEAKFTFYYASLAEQRYGVYDLEEYLSHSQWVEGAYKVGEFDCSEMAAYLEWKLENEGYHTVIVGGDNPSGSGSHAWLLVETSQGKYMPVEPTTHSIVYWENPYFDNYFVYTLEYETIFDAIELKTGAFDWWD